MRKTSVCILTLALMCGTAALSLAADTKAPATKDQGTTATSSGSASTTTSTSTGTDTTTMKTTKTTKVKHMVCKGCHGTVASKDDTAKSFVVHPKTGDDMTFMTNDKTSYWHGKKKATWADLAVGDGAKVTCMMDGTNMVAKTVKMSTAKGTDAGMKH